jgi:hypothetical protein
MARSSHDARSTGRRPKRLKARRVRRLSTFYASCNKHSKINQVWNNHSKNEMLSRRWVAGRLPSRQAAWQEETDVSRDHLELQSRRSEGLSRPGSHRRHGAPRPSPVPSSGR